jgi:hypothetical protein
MSKWTRLAFALALSTAYTLPTLAQAQEQPNKTSPAPKAQYMFVQNADGVAFEGNKLVLKDVDAATIYFTDRPVRQAGHVKTKDFMGMWSEGQDSFAKDPPNASLTILQPGGKSTDMVVTLSNPQLKGNDLTYDYKTLQGEPPKESGAAALFIDWVAVRMGAPPVVVVPRRVVVVR